MATKPGTAHTQFMTVLNALGVALATILNDFSIADLIKCLEKKGEKLTQFLRLTLTALLTDQEVVIATSDGQTNVSSLLEPVSAAVVEPTKEFIAQEHFQIGDSSGVKFAWFGDNFKKHFLKKVERNVEGATIKSNRLKEASLDPFIIAALGLNYQTMLAHLFSLLKKQGHGESGFLLTNGYANVFYIRDDEDTLWAVHAHWDGDGWRVEARSVGRPYGWYAVGRAFGR